MAAKIIAPNFRTDGWLNTLTGIGTTRDKRLAGAFEVDSLTPEQCEELYRSNDMAARIAEAIPEEMTREWVDLKVEGDQEQAEGIIKITEELNLQERVREALSIARAMGGAGILMSLDDGMDPEKPVIPERVRGIEHMTVLDCRELIPVTWYRDPFDPRCGLPELFQVNPIAPNGIILSSTVNGVLPQVHESRVLAFDGVRTTRRQRLRNRGWGESIYVRCYEVLRDFGHSWASAANLMMDYAQGFLKVKGLAELVSTNEDDKIIKRAQLMDLSRSIARMIILDSEEEFGRDVASLAGMDAMLDKFALRLAAAARMPVSLLMGQAPAGLNATGDSDIRWFYDQVAALQRKQILPHLKRITPWLFATAGAQVPENWSWEFKRLWQMTDAEQAQLRKTQADTDVAYISAQVLMPEEVALSRFGGDAYSTDTTIDIEARKAMQGHRMEAQKVGLEREINPPMPGEPGGPPLAPRPPGGESPPGAGKPKQDEDDLNEDAWDESKHPRHPKGSPEGGRFALTASKERVWTGARNQPISHRKQLTKDETGLLGEQLSFVLLRAMGMKGVRELHPGTAGHNIPADLVSSTHLIEVKAGLAASTNPKWKNSFSAPKGKEREWYLMVATETQQRAFNKRKLAKIMQAKERLRAKLSKELGRELKTMTIGVVVNPDTGLADFHVIPGFHKEGIGWSSDLAKETYHGTYRYHRK